MKQGLIATLAALALACACEPSGTGSIGVVSPTATHSAATPTTQPLGALGCRPPSPSGAFPAEVYGTAVHGTIWAWFQIDYPPKSGVEDKTVWRLDGADLNATPTFSLQGPTGQVGLLDWVAEHGSSNWNRPGVEYGTGLLFPVTGCWDVHVTLGQLQGDIYVVVA